tara:strand:- start:1933 stop:2916 length:984 start_codon:yes stop_codon:yes gene_type:complete
LKDEFYISLIGEAFDGYTEAVINDQTVYIKHISIRDQRYLHKYYQKYKEIALSKGVESEEERLAYVIEEGLWDEADDRKIAALEFEIKNLKSSIKSLFLPSQREAMTETIAEREAEAEDLRVSRKEVMGKTAEDYATSRSGDEISRFLLFKNSDLTEHFYTEKEFAELETWEIIKINSLQTEIHKRLTDDTIQEAVLRPFFSMYLSSCEKVAAFYAKPVTALSIYQLKVVLYGNMFFNIFQHTTDVPDDIKENPQKLLAFSDAQRNKDNNRGGIKDDADASMVFGATKDDMKGFEGKDGNTALREEAEKHGGTLDMKQMMRLAGHDV